MPCDISLRTSVQWLHRLKSIFDSSSPSLLLFFSIWHLTKEIEDYNMCDFVKKFLLVFDEHPILFFFFYDVSVTL